VSTIGLGLNVVERFLGFIDVSEKQDTDALSTSITNFLKENNITEPILPQSYDGVSVMSGRFNEVLQKTKSKYPEEIYIHSMPHRIILIVFDMCKIVKISYYYLHYPVPNKCH
jgi:hypothetical protein